MADLMGREGRRSRGQIILVTAFALAVSFVALALVLNSVIYTENLATRSEAAKASDAVKVKSDMVDATADIIRYVNEHNASEADYGELVENVTTGVNNTTQYARGYQIANGQAINARFVATDKGTWINQSFHDPSFNNRNFTDAKGNASWTLVNGTDGARQFSVNVTGSDRLSDKDEPGNFTVVVRDSGAPSPTWRTKIYHDDSQNSYNVSVVVDGNQQPECWVDDSAPYFWVNVSAGTVDGGTCSSLQFVEGVDAPYDISYLNGDNINGTYEVLVNETYSNVRATDDTTYNATGASRPPLTDKAIYGGKIFVEYEERSMVYETDAHVLRGESDD